VTALTGGVKVDNQHDRAHDGYHCADEGCQQGWHLFARKQRARLQPAVAQSRQQIGQRHRSQDSLKKQSFFHWIIILHVKNNANFLDAKKINFSD